MKKENLKNKGVKKKSIDRSSKKPNAKFNKNKLFTCIFSLLFLIIIVVCIFLFLGKKNASNFNFELSEANAFKIENCYDKNDKNCMHSTNYYYNIVLHGDYPLLQKEVDDINKETKSLYENAKSTLTDTDDVSDSCYAVKDIYRHRVSYGAEYYGYENDDFVTIAIQREEYNFCDNKSYFKQAESYIYDKKDDKIISQDEFKKKLKITDKEINTAIENYVNWLIEQGEEISLRDTYDNIVLFYGLDGEVYVSFEISELNGYFSSIIRPAPSK